MRETAVNLAILAALLAVPLAARLLGEPFVVTLATKAAILGLAGGAVAIFERSLSLSKIAVQRAPNDVEAEKALMNSEFSMAT